MKRQVGRILLLVPSLLWVGAVCYFEGIYLFINAALAAAFHECGHLLAFSALSLPAPKAIAVARGIRLSSRAALSYREELLIAAAGPAANLACAFSVALAGEALAFARGFADASLMAALCNLMPLSEMDGERILVCLISPRLTPRGVHLLRGALGGGILFLGLFVSLGLLWQTGEGTYPAFLLLASLLTRPIVSLEK